MELNFFIWESQILIKVLFELAWKNKPTIIFIDEIDSILSERSEGENEVTPRFKTKFLIPIQDDKGILVLGFTNIPWGLDQLLEEDSKKNIS